MKKIKCPCCDSVNSYEAWYELSSDDFYICPSCRNTCTPDEIEPQLKNTDEIEKGEKVMSKRYEQEYAELDEKTAVQIMKWKAHYKDGSLISFMTDKDKLLYFSQNVNERDWKPSFELVQAFQVIETLRQADIYLDVKCDIEGYSLSAYIEGTLYEYHQRVQLHELPSWICEIALESIKPKEPIPVFTAVIRKG